MNRSRRTVLVLGPLAGLALLAACQPSSTAKTAKTASASSAATQTAGGTAAPVASPTGERKLGDATLETGYDGSTGNVIYTQGTTPPASAGKPTVAPLWLVVYPPGSTVTSGGTHLNCEGVPGNCPDHDALVAGVVTRAQPAVYGSDSTAVPGHDHVYGASGVQAGFDNVTWEINVVAFTPKAKTDGAINTHLTTEAEIQKAKEAGDVQTIDAHASIHASMVPDSTYAKGTPVSGS